ncbi:hypothetical protein VNI00_009471 [Paramarasmius palmivorus]|uniref:Zn(2)-C6 fungal-type domain-containing protein n=1 Tax=Paramarasmius palmivorus TaxID=297713 RepID=A0AAW0CQD7_9AGAR
MLSLPAIEDTPSPAESVSSSASGDAYPINDSELAKISYTGSGARCRTAVACDKCRERKTKCSGERPVCKRCSSRGLICVYASRETKRRPAHSGAHGGTRTLVVRDDILESVGSISRANSDGYSIHKTYSSRLGQFARRPSDPFIEQHHPSPYHSSYFTQPYAPQMNHFPRGATHTAMYSGIPYDNFVGLAERDVALMSQSRSVSHQFDPLYYMRRQSASSESSASSLGSAPHTPTDPCHTLVYPSSCPNPVAIPASYSPDSEYNFYLGNNHASYSLGHGGKNHSSESFHPTASTALTEHPDQYDRDSGFPGVDHLGPRPSPMKLGSEFGASPACNQILGGSQWHSTSPSPLSWADPYTATPLTTTPEGAFDRETSVHDDDSRLAGSLLLEPVTLSLTS